MRRYQTSLILVVLFFCMVLLPPVWAQVSEAHPDHPNEAHAILSQQQNTDLTSSDQAGRQRYEAGQYAEAIALWQFALTGFEAGGSSLQQAMTLSNLSLAHQQLGQWQAANDRIQAALTLLESLAEGTLSGTRLPVQAQALDVLGRLQLVRGDAEAALTTWEQAASLYTSSTETLRLAQNRINQARALQVLGVYPQARRTLQAVNQTLENQPNSPLKVQVLQALGNVLRVVGDWDTAQQVLEDALSLAEAQTETQTIGEIQVSLGDIAQAQGAVALALEYYQTAAIASAPITQITAQLRQLALLLNTDELAMAQALWPQILTQLDKLPEGRPAVYARIELGQSLMVLVQEDPAIARTTADLLVTALQQAQNLTDQRAESYALGTLGELYAATQQLTEAEPLIRQALSLAEAITASDISYRWQWQLARLLATQGDRGAAIAAYQTAVNTLEVIRRDLLAINPDIQFSFREDVEPVYRELVDLLLQTAQPLEDAEVPALALQNDLRQARSTIELLQIAELDNFFREACLVPGTDLDLVVDRTDPTAAVLYAITLPDRTEVVLKLPNQPLRHYAAQVPQAQVEQTIQALRQGLETPFGLQQTEQTAQTIYNWLIQPIATELEQHNIQTLVFVLDGALRNIPMAALYDGEAYLIEHYAIALTPGLQLINPQPLAGVSLDALAAGLTESRPDFPEFGALPNVQQELEQIQTAVNSQILLNEQFIADDLQQQVDADNFTVLHFATHGRFSSEADETFIIAWDRKILVNEIDELLRDRDQSQADALELLVLSACETAAGDQRAALGLAGVAVRAGARSTIASLWAVPDESTAILMSEFYTALATPDMTRAEALRQAQLALLESFGDSHPRKWSPFILLGSWL